MSEKLQSYNAEPPYLDVPMSHLFLLRVAHIIIIIIYSPIADLPERRWASRSMWIKVLVKPSKRYKVSVVLKVSIRIPEIVQSESIVE